VRGQGAHRSPVERRNSRGGVRRPGASTGRSESLPITIPDERARHVGELYRDPFSVNASRRARLRGLATQMRPPCASTNRCGRSRAPRPAPLCGPRRADAAAVESDSKHRARHPPARCPLPVSATSYTTTPYFAGRRQGHGAACRARERDGVLEQVEQHRCSRSGWRRPAACRRRRAR
jgi:hypothetical protein